LCLKFLRASQHVEIYCDPKTVKVAITTIGDICPGTNVVIKGLVKCLNQYGVKDIFGVKWGFRGFTEDYPKHWTKLDPESVEGI